MAVSEVVICASLWDLERGYWLNLGGSESQWAEDFFDDRTNSHTISVPRTHLAFWCLILRAHIRHVPSNTLYFKILYKKHHDYVPFFLSYSKLPIDYYVFFLCHFFFCPKKNLIMNSKLTFNSTSFCFRISSTKISGRCQYLSFSNYLIVVINHQRNQCKLCNKSVFLSYIVWDTHKM